MLRRKGIGCTVDSDVGEIEISFMESKKKNFNGRNMKTLCGSSQKMC